VIIDLERFVAAERTYWKKLEELVDKLEDDPGFKMDLEQLKEFHYLYDRTSAGLGKVSTFASEPELRRYLESLVARAYGEIHEIREKPHRLQPARWFLVSFPQTVRRHAGALWLSVGLMLAGALFGGLALALDSGAKPIIIPPQFAHLYGDPSERVAFEERQGRREDGAMHTTFSSTLIANNTRVSILAMAMGITWGAGTILILFYNGIILGAVAGDYALAGEIKFLLGWLLPHGSIEIPAILIAGQAGLVLGGAVIGWGTRDPMRLRLRKVTPDLVTLIFGVAILLVWAGLVEAFLSQYHEPVISYSTKIAFGTLELAVLALFLWKAGTPSERRTPPPHV
jgi:uncharacterized membrane protein SpoIIM required for sporulation